MQGLKDGHTAAQLLYAEISLVYTENFKQVASYDAKRTLLKAELKFTMLFALKPLKHKQVTLASNLVPRKSMYLLESNSKDHA